MSQKNRPRRATPQAPRRADGVRPSAVAEPKLTRRPEGFIPYLAGAATLWAAAPLFAGSAVHLTWASVLFALAVGAVAFFVAHTANKLCPGGGTTERAKAAVLLVLLVLVPLAMDPRTKDGFNLVKFTVTLIGALTIAAIWVLEAARQGSGLRWRNGLHWPVVGLVAWTGIATAMSISPRLSILGAIGTYHGLLAATAFAVIFFATVQAVTMDRVAAVLSVLFFGAGGLIVLHGVVQLHDRVFGGPGWDWLRDRSGQSPRCFAGGAIFTSFDNPNHLGGFLAVLVPIGAILFFLHRSPRLRILTAAIVVALFVQLIQTASRGALLAMLTALATAAALLGPEARRRPKISLASAAAVVACVLIGMPAMGMLPQCPGSKLSAAPAQGSSGLAGVSSGLAQGDTLTLRTDLWRVGVKLANDRPVVGDGPATFQDRYRRYQSAELAQRHGPRAYSHDPHNLFVNQLIATGYPGLALLLAVLMFGIFRAVGATRRLRRMECAAPEEVSKRSREARLALVAVVAGMAAHIVQASFALSQIALSFVFWVLLGLLCAISLGAGVPTSLSPRDLLGRAPGQTGLVADIDPDFQTRPRPAPRPDAGGNDFAGPAISLVACIGLVLAVSTATRPLRADHNAWAADAIQASARRLPPDEAARLSRRVETLVAKAISLNPWEPSYVVREADAQRIGASSLPDRSPSQVTTLRSARRAYERAIQLRPDNSAFLESYADVLLKLDQVDPAAGDARTEAITALRRAVRSDPYSAELRERLQVTSGSD